MNNPVNHPAAEDQAFALSRIHGQGWTAAKRLIAEGNTDVDASQAAARNPYRAGEERARWSKGFSAALRSRAGAFSTPGGHSWRPAAANPIAAETGARKWR